MSEPYEKVDPDGDVLVFLSAPRTPFAPWREDTKLQSSHTALPDSELLKSEPAPAEEPPSEKMGGEPAAFCTLASSKHLALASPVFRKMFSGTWKEGSQVYPDGFRHVKLADFDPRALSILMYIVHLRHRRIPKSVDTEMLAKIAVLVDYFECHEAVEPFSDGWIVQLEGTVPTDYNRDLVLWILISSVFTKPAIFRVASYRVVLYATQPFRTLELPISQSIVDRIDQSRAGILDKCFTDLNKLRATLQDDRGRCSFICDSIMLGALIKNMQTYQLFFEQPPSELYIGLSVAMVSDAMTSFQCPVLQSSCKDRLEVKGNVQASSSVPEPNQDEFESRSENSRDNWPFGEAYEPRVCSLNLLLSGIGGLRGRLRGLEL